HGVGQAVAVLVGVGGVGGVQAEQPLQAVGEGVAVGERRVGVAADQLRAAGDGRDPVADDLRGVVDAVAVGVLADRVEDEVIGVHLVDLARVAQAVAVLVVPAGGGGGEVRAVVVQPVLHPVAVAVRARLRRVEVGVGAVGGGVHVVGPLRRGDLPADQRLEAVVQ